MNFANRPHVIRQMPVGDLQPAPYNPRRKLDADAKAYRKLKRSLEEFGLVEPLVWNESTGHLVGGHFRLRILKELGYSEVPVTVVQLTAEREKALNIVLNNREAQGRFDPELLNELLAELEPLPELELTGFDAGDLPALDFEPEGELPAEPQSMNMEIAFVVGADRYRELESAFDQFIREHDLEAHVTRIPGY